MMINTLILPYVAPKSLIALARLNKSWHAQVMAFGVEITEAIEKTFGKDQARLIGVAIQIKGNEYRSETISIIYHMRIASQLSKCSVAEICYKFPILRIVELVSMQENKNELIFEILNTLLKSYQVKDSLELISLINDLDVKKELISIFIARLDNYHFKNEFLRAPKILVKDSRSDLSLILTEIALSNSIYINFESIGELIQREENTIQMSTYVNLLSAAGQLHSGDVGLELLYFLYEMGQRELLTDASKKVLDKINSDKEKLRRGSTLHAKIAINKLKFLVVNKTLEEIVARAIKKDEFKELISLLNSMELELEHKISVIIGKQLAACPLGVWECIRDKDELIVHIATNIKDWSVEKKIKLVELADDKYKVIKHLYSIQPYTLEEAEKIVEMCKWKSWHKLFPEFLNLTFPGMECTLEEIVRGIKLVGTNESLLNLLFSTRKEWTVADIKQVIQLADSNNFSLPSLLASKVEECTLEDIVGLTQLPRLLELLAPKLTACTVEDIERLIHLPGVPVLLARKVTACTVEDIERLIHLPGVPELLARKVTACTVEEIERFIHLPGVPVLLARKVTACTVEEIERVIPLVKTSLFEKTQLLNLLVPKLTECTVEGIERVMQLAEMSSYAKMELLDLLVPKLTECTVEEIERVMQLVAMASFVKIKLLNLLVPKLTACTVEEIERVMQLAEMSSSAKIKLHESLVLKVEECTNRKSC